MKTKGDTMFIKKKKRKKKRYYFLMPMLAHFHT